ncbi:hypothetical protein AVEN_30957-1 [Araneus ventricosus]|uniref:Secreted protein n=1 Tax=Araneus ventricosus TaxID=182803 RepID=A0A4Y2RSN2_ARAVE|nr:hypothetical protein AVEN_30957-1 [Araneus ventricosus]
MQWSRLASLMCNLFTATTWETTDALTSPRATSILPVQSRGNKANRGRNTRKDPPLDRSFIPYLQNGKNRCGSWACKTICRFPRCGGKRHAHQRKKERPDGAITSFYSSAAEIFAKPRAVGTARLFEFQRPQSTNTNFERLEFCPSHTPLEQGSI